MQWQCNRGVGDKTVGGGVIGLDDECRGLYMLVTRWVRVVHICENYIECNSHGKPTGDVRRDSSKILKEGQIAVGGSIVRERAEWYSSGGREGRLVSKWACRGMMYIFSTIL